MASPRRRVRARRGSGSIRRRGERYLAQVSLGVDAAGRRIRHARTVDTREQAQTWIAEQQAGSGQLTKAQVVVEPQSGCPRVPAIRPDLVWATLTRDVPEVATMIRDLQRRG